MRVKAQLSMVFNLEKCIGCNTCSVACKNVWTNREGAEYMWWNNVETKPGIGYPRQWENQSIWKGGWEKKNGKLQLRQGSPGKISLSLFHNPNMPQMCDYYGDDVYTFTYDDLHESKSSTQQPVGRPKSMVTDEHDIPIRWGANWEDNAGGAHETGKLDTNFAGMSKEEHEAYLKFQQVFYFYLPRICNHCMNPACVGSCPSGAAYKREEDGIVLIDQQRCRNWRYCVSGCPYKKPYYNWRSGKMEKCILCYPRIEAGLAPACFHSCVGKIRYFGLLLYDMDRLETALLAEDQELVGMQREAMLDPHDPMVIAAARAAGYGDDWIDAAQRSPVHKLVKKWGIALPLHPEFRTMPSLFYVPPQSPMTTTLGKDTPSTTDIFDMTRVGEGGPIISPDEIDKMRVPLRYLANLFSAGNENEVAITLKRQLAVRHYQRRLRVDGVKDLSALEKQGLTEADAEAMTRLLSLAFLKERFVVPTTKREKADISPYTERGFTGFDQMTPWSPMKRRKSSFAAHHTPEKDYE